jgi:hypothetical protein
MKKQRPVTDLEVKAILEWSKTHCGTERDVKRELQELKARTLREIKGLLEKLVAEGRLLSARVSAPSRRYTGWRNRLSICRLLHSRRRGWLDLACSKLGPEGQSNDPARPLRDSHKPSLVLSQARQM